MTQPCYTYLSDTDRETLSLGLAQGQSLGTLAQMLRRAPSTMSREVARNHARHTEKRTAGGATKARGWKSRERWRMPREARAFTYALVSEAFPCRGLHLVPARHVQRLSWFATP
jgi:IS30 family transposase